MIYDGENMFFKDQDLSATTLTSDILDVGVGEASDPMHLVASVTNDAGAGNVTVALDTSDDSTFTSYTTIGTFVSPTFTTSFTLAQHMGPVVSAKIPRGNKGYLRIRATSTFTDGQLTAGLVLDDDVPNK